MIMARIGVGLQCGQGHPPPDAAALRALGRGVHPAHLVRAELVAAAVRATLLEETP